MRIIGTIILALLASLSVVSSVSAQNSPLLLSSINLSSASVTEGHSVQATVTLNMAAPGDGARVSLAVDPVGAAMVPASITVPSGATTATFPVKTGTAASVTIYGNYGVTRSESLSVMPRVSIDQVADRVIERERAFVAQMKHMHPLAETYIQNLKTDKESVVVPSSDQYFLGRLDLSHGVEDQMFEKETGLKLKSLNPFPNIFTRKFMPLGFAQMVMLDGDFQKKNYDFKFVRQEFLGEVRCIVIDVQPKDNAGGRFVGRIWVEDHDYNIVRFNGTYSAHSRYSYYLHFDSWRLNLQAGLWLPAYVFIEESNLKNAGPLLPGLHFKAQTRLWSYDPEPLKHEAEFSDIQIDSVRDQTDSANDAGPVEAQRMWERTAEDNALDHLQKVGLLAPPGDVDKILQTVVNNLIITNDLQIIPDVRCRVLLTSPLESFTIGHTIVISRGLLDVLPDEGSLAVMLAHELGHIALGHRIDTKFAFNDRFFFPDENTFQRMDFARNASEEEAADSKAMQLLEKSPYKDKLAKAGLFLKALNARAPELTSLIRPHMGNRLESGKMMRMSALLSSAPQLEEQSLDQIAALPLGGRIKLDPWSDRLEMMKTKPVVLLSPQEKMPFEVTPFFPYLTRLSTTPVETASAQ
ncbi:MAG: M48 family metalloprotease [Terriglobales bacterium]